MDSAGGEGGECGGDGYSGDESDGAHDAADDFLGDDLAGQGLSEGLVAGGEEDQ